MVNQAKDTLMFMYVVHTYSFMCMMCICVHVMRLKLGVCECCT